MKYEYSNDLQKAVFTAIHENIEIVEVTEGAIFDHVPSTQILPEIYVRIGDEQLRNRSTKTNSITESIFEVSVFSQKQGFLAAKKLSSKLAEQITNTHMGIESGKLVGIWFIKSQTYRLEKGNLRQIKLWFKAIIEENKIEEVLV